jgi:ribosomal protein L29
MKKIRKTVQSDLQSLEEKKEELAELARTKLKHGQLKKLQMFANERQYILSLLKKYCGKKYFSAE